MNTRNHRSVYWQTPRQTLRMRLGLLLLMGLGACFEAARFFSG